MDTLLDVGLANALAATLLALLAAAVTRVWRRPALAHALWLLVLLKLLTPPLFFVPVWPRPAGPAPEDGSPAPAVEERPRPQVVLEAPPAAAPAAPSVPADRVPNFSEAAPAAADVASGDEPAPVWPRLPSWRVLVVAAWLAGSLCWLAVAAVRIRRFRLLLRHARAAPDEVQQQGRVLAASLGLRRCPPALFVPAPLSPLLWALVGPPRLLLPEALWKSLTEQQRGTLLAHELAHLRRRDHWVRWLELVVLGLYWWHPVAWWARRELREAEEQCCDAWVLWALPDAAEVYARALLQTLAFLSQSRPPLPVGASGAGRVSLLKRRLTMILRGSTSRALGWPGLVALLLVAAALLPLLPTWAQRAQDAPAKPPAADEPADRPKKEADEGLAEARKLRHRFTELLTKFNMLFKQGRYQEAEHFAREALKLDPEDSTAVAAVALAQARRQQVKDPSRREVPSGSRAEEPQASLAEQIDRARDEVELLEAQLQVKEAQLQAAQDAIRRARQHLELIQKARAQGAIPETELLKATDAVASAETDALLKKAELKEPQVRLNQARRRLEALLRQAPSSDSERKPSWADAAFQEIYKDFGPVRNDHPLTHRFRLTNRNAPDLHIAGIRSSCACLTAKAVAPEAGPGKDGFIEVTLDPSKFSGPKVVRVYVQFDKPAAEEAILLVRADSRSELPPESKPDPKAEEKHRLEELDKKIDTLLKELERLRRDLPRKGPMGLEIPGDPGKDVPVIAINRRSFKIPIQVDDAQKNRIRGLMLFYSLNEGGGWVQVGSFPPDTTEFKFEAPRDGLYWFAVITTDEKGYPKPPQPRCNLKVLIDTVKPRVEATLQRDRDGLTVIWAAQDENLDPASAVAEYRLDDGPWTPLVLRQPTDVGKTNVLKFEPKGTGTVTVRVRVKDTAGNEGVAQVQSLAEER
jgi:beta-lactamase regulating signal transducer with metallopeptidase domain